MEAPRFAAKQSFNDDMQVCGLYLLYIHQVENSFHRPSRTSLIDRVRNDFATRLVVQPTSSTEQM